MDTQRHRSVTGALAPQSSATLLAALTVAGIGCFSGAESVAADLFLPHVEYASGGGTTDVALADLNSDGKLDVVAPNAQNSNVSVFLGTGSGTLGAAAHYTTGVAPKAVAIDDFNGDGKLDLAVAARNCNCVSILLGAGDGTFGAPTNFATGIYSYGVAVGDFNEDGKVDLVVANAFSSNVSVLLGRGDGTFNAATNLATIGGNPGDVSVADFNGDEHADFAVSIAAGVPGYAAVFLGDGSGGFAPRVDYPIGVSAADIRAQDVTGDGNVDLVTSNGGSRNVSVLVGNGDGTFAPALYSPVGMDTGGFVLADFDGDGKQDVAVAELETNLVAVLFGDGTGAFGSRIDFAVGDYPQRMAIGDLDGNGSLDVLSANYFGGSVSVLLATAGAPPDSQAPTWPAGSTLTASNVTAYGADLAWTAAQDNVAVTQYQVFQDGERVATLDASTQSFSVGDLTSSMTYAFNVEACDTAGNCSTTGPSASVTTLSLPPDQQIENIVGDVQALVSSGKLSQKQANALTVTLNAALASVEANRDVSAIEQLQAFVNQVKALVKAKKLSAADGQALIDAALEVEASIESLDSP